MGLHLLGQLHSTGFTILCFLQRVPVRSSLPRESVTQGKRTINTLKKSKTQNSNTERTQGEDNLTLSTDIRSLGQKNKGGPLVSTSLSLSLAYTFWVDRVNLYGLKINGTVLSSS
jgi:hypothetical protein